MRKAEAEKRKAANKIRRETQAQLTSTEELITELEARQTTLSAELENPASLSGSRANLLNRELSTLQDRLLKTMETWESLTASLAETAPEEAESLAS